MKKIILTLGLLAVIVIPLVVSGVSDASGLPADTSGGVFTADETVISDVTCSPKPTTTQTQEQQIVVLAQKMAKMGNILGNPVVQQYYSLIDQYNICTKN